ncbi:MAG TPA: hypothetical protein EYN66_09115 [Myxococcales bacterium]|nr:hypothetical protein [Myxococcales bacterium]
MSGLSAKEAPKGSGVSGLVGARMGWGLVDNDQFLSLNIGTALRWGKLGIGIQAPLRFRVVDKDPQNDGSLRKEDWDEVSDWTRVLRYVEWGTPKDPIYTRVGVLEGTTIGHGTIVNQYYNVIDADHYQTGVQLHVDLDIAGGQFFVDNMIDPELFGVRGFVRPFQFFKVAPLFKRIGVGLTVVIDGAAPKDPKTLNDKDSTRIINDDGDLVTDSNSVAILGLDVDWALISTDSFALTPYVDFNVLGTTGGTGFHAGILTQAQVTAAVKLGGRLEYRAVNEDYAPSYVNSWYEVERVEFLNGKTKIDYFTDKDKAGLEGIKHGFAATLDLNILKAILLSATYEDYQGPDNANLLLKLGLPWIASFKLNAYYAKRNFDSINEAFDLDRGLLIAELKWKFAGPFYVYALYSREWRLNKDNPNDPDNYDTTKRSMTLIRE